MGARNLKSSLRHFVPEPVKIFSRSVGAAGASPTALQTTGAGSAGVASIVWTGTGLYTVTLDDKWNNLLAVQGSVLDATAPDDWEVTPVTEAVATTKVITIAVFKGGALADLTTDEQLLLEITVMNSARKR